jgi:hypothetical protein
MSNKKQTAVEFLVDQLEKWELYNKISFQCLKDIEQAKEMEKEKVYSEEDVVSILEYARKNFYDTGTKWHEEPYMDLTSQELIKKYHEQ